MAGRAVAMIRIEAAWLSVEPIDMRAGTDTAVNHPHAISMRLQPKCFIAKRTVAPLETIPFPRTGPLNGSGWASLRHTRMVARNLLNQLAGQHAQLLCIQAAQLVDVHARKGRGRHAATAPHKACSSQPPRGITLSQETTSKCLMVFFVRHAVWETRISCNPSPAALRLRDSSTRSRSRSSK
jgi:hypothetical protein